MNADTGNTPVVVQPTEYEISSAFEREMWNDPLGVFLKYHLGSVRQKCLETIGDRNNFPDYPIDFVKQIIKGLNARDDTLGRDLLELFVIKSDGGEMAPLAIEFAIEIAMSDSVELNRIAKTVVARLQKEEYTSYWRVPSMELFINFLLDQARGGHENHNYEYTNSDWIQVQRAMNIIMKFRDTTFLPILNDLLEKMKSGETKLWEQAGEFEAADNIHFLQTRTEWLSKIAEAEKLDWKILGSLVKKEAKLKGNVDVGLAYTETIKKGRGAIVLIKFKASRPEEQPKLNAWIEREPINIICETDEVFKRSTTQGKFYTHLDNANWMVELTPSLWKNRLSIYVKDGNRIISRAVAYIRCVKEIPAAAPTA